jgi:DNA-directed RNA polymerase specialized sigma24 family protein
MSQTINDDQKREVIRKVREENMSVGDVSIDTGISTKTIYRILRDGVDKSSQNLLLENRKLKKENEQLYAMLGKATAMMTRPKN